MRREPTKRHPSWACGVACAIALSGCTAKYYQHAADKAAYRLISQKSRGVTNMEPHFTIEQTNVLRLAGLPVARQVEEYLGAAAESERGAAILSMEDALAMAIKNNRTYQNSKEQLYISALALSLAQHQFAPIFSGGGSATVNGPAPPLSDGVAEQLDAKGNAGASWLVRDLGKITGAFTTDFLRFLAGNPSSVISSELGATFTRPLLRNAGYKTDIENLTQAERNLLYAVRDFVRTRKDFSVQVASAYYDVLGSRDFIRNSFMNLQSSRLSAAQKRAWADEGRATQTDLGRLEQQELSAESTWIGAIRTYLRALDDFKIQQLGIPVESKIVLADRELQQLGIKIPALSVDDAIKIALAARLDYQNIQDRYDDSLRQVKLAADQLKPDLTLTAGASMSQKRAEGFAVPDPHNYNWNAGLALDLPFERTRERNNYRTALITQDRAARAASLQKDQIQLDIREGFRSLDETRRSYEISAIGVKLAERRVDEQNLLAELGRAKAQDQVDAQNAFADSKNSLTQALVRHTKARLGFWRDMGILFIKENGQWEEMKATAQAANTNPAK